MEARRAHNPEVVGSSPASATSLMYAHANGESAVCVGVVFCDVLPDNDGHVLIVPRLYAGVKHCFDSGRVYLCVGGGAAGDYIFKFGLSGPQPVKLCFQFRDHNTRQVGLHAAADLGRHLGQLCLGGLERVHRDPGGADLAAPATATRSRSGPC